MTRGILLALLGLTLAGCQIIEPRYPSGPSEQSERVEVIDRGEKAHEAGRVARQVAFPADEYAALDKRGSAAIRGRLTIGGRPIADRPVAVAPVTTYSAEAAEQALAGRAVEPADPRARAYTHTARTDADGRFRLEGLPAGEFYVSSSARDPVSGEARVIIQQVSLGSGQTRRVELRR